jgi:hypothetical protein
MPQVAIDAAQVFLRRESIAISKSGPERGEYA